jgi:hypothetical protein
MIGTEATTDATHVAHLPSWRNVSFLWTMLFLLVADILLLAWLLNPLAPTARGHQTAPANWTQLEQTYLTPPPVSSDKPSPLGPKTKPKAATSSSKRR